MDSFSGLWDVTHATLPSGEFAYSGRISIEPQASAFALDWDISAGHYVGVGLASGGHLLVACGEQLAGLGLALFHGHAGAAPAISWSVPELAGALGGGVWESPWAGGFEGEHALAFVLPDGRLYGEWSLAAVRAGQVYELEWRKGDAVHLRGIGLDIAGGMAAYWYPDPAQLACMDYAPVEGRADQLQAVWALGGFTALGSELLTRVVP